MFSKVTLRSWKVQSYTPFHYSRTLPLENDETLVEACFKYCKDWLFLCSRHLNMTIWRRLKVGLWFYIFCGISKMWPAFLIFNKNRRYKKFHSDFKIKIVKIQSDKFRTQDTGRSIAKTRKFKRTQAFNFIFFYWTFYLSCMQLESFKLVLFLLFT